MADFGASFKTWAKAQSSITAVIGSGTSARIFPGLLRQGSAMPAVMYTIGAGGDSQEHLKGRLGMAETIMHVYSYAATRSAADQLDDIIRLVLQTYRGLMTTHFVCDVIASGPEWGEDWARDGSDVHRYWTRRVYNVTHNES